MRRLDGVTDLINGHEFEETPGNSEGQGTQHAAVLGVAKSWT